MSVHITYCKWYFVSYTKWFSSTTRRLPWVFVSIFFEIYCVCCFLCYCCYSSVVSSFFSSVCVICYVPKIPNSDLHCDHKWYELTHAWIGYFYPNNESQRLFFYFIFIPHIYCDLFVEFLVFCYCSFRFGICFAFVLFVKTTL